MALPEPPLSIKFHLGHSTASALARHLDPEDHPHVLSATLIRGIWHRLVLAVLLRLPFKDLVRRLWPVYFLPDTVVLKLYKPAWDPYYRVEQDMYKRLEPLQGRVIPVYYGEARYAGTRALVLSEVRGVLACEQKNPPRVDVEEFRRRIRVAVEELGRFGMVQADRKLHNVFLVEDRVMFIDLEMVYEMVDDPEGLAFALKYSAAEFGNHYVDYLSDPDT